MKLKAWRETNGLSLKRCAGLLGATNAKVVWRWENGKAVPRPATMARIYLETAGAVMPNDFYDLPPLPAEQAAA